MKRATTIVTGVDDEVDPLLSYLLSSDMELSWAIGNDGSMEGVDRLCAIALSICVSMTT